MRRIGADTGNRRELHERVENPVAVPFEVREHSRVHHYLPPSMDSTCPVIQPA